MQKETGLLERVFHLSENGTSVKTEIMAGITTFMTMAYILAVNPAIMSAAGMDKGAVLGVSTTTTYVESAAGVSEGGRTGLTAMTVAVLFILSLFLSPFFMAIPAFATAPALITVGFLMFTAVAGIDFTDMTEAIPCYLAIIAMPFAYSIAEGISFGVISYVIINTLAGKTEKISPLMYILAVLFILKYILL